MKKILLLLLLIIPIFSYAEEKVPVTYFDSPHCKICISLKAEFIPLIKEKYKEKVEWKELSVQDNQDALSLLTSLSEQFGHQKAMVPSVIVGRAFLVGGVQIKQRLENEIISAFSSKSKPFLFFKTDLLKYFKKLSVLTVIGSGLVDGVNPCAFAVIVFFISFLTVYGYRKREIACVGSAYCLAVFITYLLIGLGFFKFLYSIEKIYLLIKFFYYFVAFFCFLLGILSLVDYIRFRKTHNSEGIILQLPKFFKKRINITIGKTLRNKKRSAFSLILASFSVGFLVSLLEAVCTGQVYIPTIVFILKNTDLKLKAASYLILYNLMFIMPLIVVFLLSFFGFSSDSFNRFLKNNLGKIKISLAFVFFILGMLILRLS